eukprot:3110333-Rhodomonas_salina.2
MSGTDLAYAATRPRRFSAYSFQTGPSTPTPKVLRTCYAMSGTDVARMLLLPAGRSGPLLVARAVWSYAFAMQCPVLT